jgi:hypothetical protein
MESADTDQRWGDLRTIDLNFIIPKLAIVRGWG